MKEVLPSCFKEDEVIVRFGQDVGTVAVLWRGDKALKGKTKPGNLERLLSDLTGK